MADGLKSRYDVVIVGGGHNGLVCASYLARKGQSVAVLEQRPVLGGACVTESIGGCKVSRTSYVYSLFHPIVVRELELRKHGLEVLERDPPSFTPLKDGRYLFLYQDMKHSQEEIAKFSEKDSEAYPLYEERLDRISRFLDNILLMTPPDPHRIGDWPRMGKLGMKALGLKEDLYTLLDLFSSSSHGFVARHFGSEPLISTLCTDGIIGTCGGPFTPGTAYVLLHHVMGEVNGHRGRWGYVRGGMGGLSDSLVRSGLEHGVEYFTGADVAKILVEGSMARGVLLADGREVRSRFVVSGADPSVTFRQLLDRGVLPEAFLDAVGRIDYSSATSKINIILKGELTFKCLKGTGESVPGTFHICEDSRYIERAFDASKYGEMSDHLVIEGCVPSVVDETLAPPGKHILSLLIQYTPYHINGGWTAERRNELLRKTVQKLSEYTNIRKVFCEADIITPADLERDFRLTGGNLFQGAMSLSQLFFMRPVPGYARYRTPIRNLMLCGSAAHPGGGVTGLPGHNAARELLKLL